MNRPHKFPRLKMIISLIILTMALDLMTNSLNQKWRRLAHDNTKSYSILAAASPFAPLAQPAKFTYDSFIEGTNLTLASLPIADTSSSSDRSIGTQTLGLKEATMIEDVKTKSQFLSNIDPNQDTLVSSEKQIQNDESATTTKPKHSEKVRIGGLLIGGSSLPNWRDKLALPLGKLAHGGDKGNGEEPRILKGFGLGLGGLKLG